MFLHRLAKDLGEMDVAKVAALPYSKILNWMMFYKLEREAQEDANEGRAPRLQEQGPKDEAEKQIAFFEAYNARVTGKYQSFRDMKPS